MSHPSYPSAGQRRGLARLPGALATGLATGLGRSLARGIDRLLPPGLRTAAPDLRMRARFLVALAVVSFVPGVIMLTMAVSLGRTQILLPMALRATLLAAALIVLWRRSRVELPGHLVFASTFLYLLWGAHDLRATFPLMALSVLPMAALLLCGPRAGWMWLLAVCVASPAAVLVFEIRVPGAPGAPGVQVPALLSPVLLALVVFALGWVYEMLKQRALAELEQQKVQALEGERRIHDSERRALEAEHARAQAEAQARIQESSRMVALGTLSAGVAHEINNPLAVVMANVQFLDDMLQEVADQLGPGQRAELVEILVDTVDGLSRIRRIVRDLGTFSRAGERDDLAAINVRTVMEAALNLARNHVGQRATVVREYGPAPLVLASEPRLAQVFLNLLINAAQAIPEGVRASNEICVRTGTDERGHAFAEVGDSGVGIPAEHLPRLFDPFFTTKAQGEGTGLGLSICHGIVSELGGQITVHSQPGQGSTFRVTLPPGAAHARARTQTPPIDAPVPARGRILIIDDEPAVARALARLLDGHEVHVAGGGREAMAVLARDPGFDAVFCDIMMADVSGIELFAHVQAAHPALAARFVFMTAGTFTPRAQAFAEEHSRVCLEKPLNEGVLQKHLCRLLGTVAENRDTTAP
jgi:signal transduction histidine kinase